MIGKSTLEIENRATEPLAQVNMDLFSSSVQSIESRIMQLYLLIVIPDTDGYMV
jgi:hypothetical protein